MMAMWGDTALTFLTIVRMPSSVAWAVLILTTFMPAKKSLRMNSCSHLLSLIDATIFVCFMGLNTLLGAKLMKIGQT